VLESPSDKNPNKIDPLSSKYQFCQSRLSLLHINNVDRVFVRVFDPQFVICVGAHD
jgi:hypothetical protein